MSDLFKNLESNNPTLVEEAKNELIKSLGQTKENWLVYGMMEHFASQNSIKVVEILVKVPQTHDTYIFDKLSEWMNINDKRHQAFKLFWLIVQKHPSWLYRVANHRLFREMLTIVKTERNINTTLHGLFCIIILLPIIPALMNDYLQDLFTIFIFLSNWKATNTPELIGNQPVYLQNGIERLFQRLYGMFPCNFMGFLSNHMNEKTIKVIEPLMKNARYNPSLLLSSPDLEKNKERWKELEPHDIVQECEKFSLDILPRSQECQQEHNEAPWYGQVIHVTPNPIIAGDRFKHSTFAPISTTETTSTKQKARGLNKWDNIWSPSSAVLATPPPTNTMAITQTPTPIMSQNYNIQSIPGSGQYSSSGASPPEAAVEGKNIKYFPKEKELNFLLFYFYSYTRNNSNARRFLSNATSLSS